jgi:hypothetical protein
MPWTEAKADGHITFIADPKPATGPADAPVANGKIQLVLAARQSEIYPLQLR